jgi:membrane protein
VNPRPLRRAWHWTLRLSREIQEDGAVDAAASVAFWLILSIPAAALAIIASLSMLDPDLVSELEQSLLDFVDRTFTSESTTLRNAITGIFSRSRPGLFSLSLVLALVTLSRGFAGLIRGLDTVYDVAESRGFIRLRVASLGLALGTLATVAASTYLWSLSGREGLPLPLRLLGALLVLVLWAATVFHVGPNHHTPWRYDLPGAVATAVGWFVVSAGFGWYVQIASRGNEIVGSIGALLLGLTWLWIACLILMIGGEINEIIADDADVIGRNLRWSTRARRMYRTLRDEDSDPNDTDSDPNDTESS